MELEKLVNKTLSLLPVIKGEAKAGFVIEDISLSPKQVVVRGPKSTLDTVDILWTEPVDVTELGATTTVDVRAAMPDVSMSLVDPVTIKATLVVTEKITSRVFKSVPVEITNAVRKVTVKPETVDITVRGPINSMAQMAAGNGLYARVDVQGLAPGKHKYRVTAYAPGDIQVVEVSPRGSGSQYHWRATSKLCLLTTTDANFFGTDGVRGVANVWPMTTETAMGIGRAAAYISKRGTNRRHKIVIGKDTRLSGYMIENALSAGICSMGVDVLLVGPLPTPGIAFITSSMRADAGVVISASHNPFQDNGIKIFDSEGYKLPDEVEAQMEGLIFGGDIEDFRPTARDVGKAFRVDDARGRYIVFLKNTFPKSRTLDGLKIVVDCANGAAYRVAPEVFHELGADVELIGVDPNGENINRGCGSLEPEVAAKRVVETGADLGIALDGDADRVIFIDHKGRIVDGDRIMAICAGDLARRDKLARGTVVATVMSNMGLDVCLRKLGLRLVRTAVGDRYVVERMRAEGFNFGGEQSGHMIFLDHNTTGDGILTALQVMAVMHREGKSLADLAGIMDTFPQVLVNVKVPKKVDLDELDQVCNQCDRVRQELGENGRLLVRYSGTEPLVRVMIEGEDGDRIKELADETAACILKCLEA